MKLILFRATAMMVGVLGMAGNIVADAESSANSARPSDGSSEKQRPALVAAPKVERIVFSCKMRLASIGPDGKDFQWIEEQSAPGGHTWGFHRLSPDGKRLAYASLNSLWVWNLQEAWPGVKLNVFGHTWCWSPDGTQLAVSTSDRQNVWKHQLIEVGTGKLTPLKLPDKHRVIDWSPDSKWFLTAAPPDDPRKGVSQVFQVMRRGQETRCLSGGCKTATMGRISPDGKQVAFLDVGKDGGLFIVDVDGGRLRQVTKEVDDLFDFLAWSPDGRRLLYGYMTAPKGKPKPGDEFDTALAIIETDGRNRVLLMKERGHYAPTGYPRGDEMLGAADWR